MTNIRIEATTEAAESEPFRVSAKDLPMGVRSWGLSGTEVMEIHENRGDGTYRLVADDTATMTATDESTSIVATGDYKIVKPVTASASGASTD